MCPETLAIDIVSGPSTSCVPWTRTRTHTPAAPMAFRMGSLVGLRRFGQKELPTLSNATEIPTIVKRNRNSDIVKRRPKSDIVKRIGNSRALSNAFHVTAMSHARQEK